MFALALSITACGDSGTVATLENGVFSYVCTRDDDPQCERDEGPDEGSLKAMPNTIAVGAQFGVVFQPISDAAQEGSANVVPVSSKLLGIVSGGFEAKKPGIVGLLAMRGSAVVDVIHVKLAPVASLSVTPTSDSTGGGTGTPTALLIAVGEALSLTATPFDEDGEPLAGSLSYDWTLDNAASLQVLSNPGARELDATATATGDTKIRVSVGGAFAEVTVTVMSPQSGGGA